MDDKGNAAFEGDGRDRADVVGSDTFQVSSRQVEEMISWRKAGAWDRAIIAVGGLTSVLWNVITVSLRQSIIPDALLGRVNSVYRFLGWGTMPIGAAVGGALAKGFGLRAPFYVSAGVLAVMGVAALPVVSARPDVTAPPTNEELTVSTDVETKLSH